MSEIKDPLWLVYSSDMRVPVNLRDRELERVFRCQECAERWVDGRDQLPEFDHVVYEVESFVRT